MRVSESIERGRLKLARRQRASDTRLAIREARVEDLDEICAIVTHWTGKGEHLPRSREDILECISEFAVAVHGGHVVGCGSLWIYTPQLAEIRSLGVAPGAAVRGVGRSLTRHLIDRAAELGIPKVFVLTRVAEFFAKCGFRTVSVNSLPEKVLKDCAACPRREACDEVAMSIDTSAAASESR
jgi:argininosuccinate lyase/amino-acid N-acetyltransferase